MNASIILRRASSLGETGGSITGSVASGAADRLAVVAITLMFGNAIALVLDLALAKIAEPDSFVLRVCTHSSTLVVAGAMVALVRSGRIPARRLLQLGFGFEVLVGLGLILPLFFADLPPPETIARAPWIVVWISIFPLVVPAHPARHLVAALVTASTLPAAYAVSRGMGWPPFPEGRHLLFTFAPVYVAAFLSAVPAWLCYRMARDMSDAQREIRRLGSYALIERLGAGGMGEVWRAEHAMLKRPAAVKLITTAKLRGEEERAAAIARFEREALATSNLESPHTIRLFDFGTTGDGSLYYAMELLRGVDLEQLVERHGVVSPARAVALLLQAAESLEEAHEVGLVHRDIKPANIVAARLGRTYDFVKVLDFGLVATLAADERREDRSRLTQEGYVVGTVTYMAPETCEGDRAADARVDVYALGCVAYWLLAGRVVFDHPSSMKVLYMHVNETPVPLSEAAPQEVPAELERLVMECLAKDPDDRPANGGELARKLRALDLAGRWTADEAETWWRMHLPEHHPSAASVAGAETAIEPALPPGAPAPPVDVAAPTTLEPAPIDPKARTSELPPP